MERISEIMAAQYALERRQAELGINKKYKKRKRTRQLPLIKSKGFTQINHFTLDLIITDKSLSKRELKVIFMILRFTVGLHMHSTDFKQANFEVAGILPGHISKILKSLFEKQWIQTTKTPKMTYYSIHKNRLLKDQPVNNPEFRKLLNKKIIKYHQK